MKPGKYDTKLVIGDDWQRTLDILDADGAPLDLTGYSGLWWLRRNRDDETPAVEMATETGEIAMDGATLTASLPRTITAGLSAGIYYHELELYSASGAKTTWLAGRILAL